MVELKASESLRICGPGGTITLDGSGVTIEGLEILLKGPVQRNPDGAGNDSSISGNPVEGVLGPLAYLTRYTH